MTTEFINADCLEWMRTQPSDSVDLVFCSPPYEAARTYGIDFNLKGQDWVDWCVERYVECVRLSRGLVAWVVEGQTRQFRYSAAPLLFMADLHRAGVHLRKPPAFHRVGIPGSGGPDWLRNDYEFIVCGTKGGKLPWSDNTAMGHPPKWAPGGAMSNRQSNGSRVNQWGHSIDSGATVVDEGGVVRSRGKRPSHELQNRGVNGHGEPGAKGGTKTDRKVMARSRRGSRDNGGYNIPALANPGNVLKLIVGGGAMGSKLAHENEAPFPGSLPEFFIRSFCPAGGTVLDIFSGSGTTVAVAARLGRNGIGVDIRQSQVELGRRRVSEVQTELIA
jgi:hypothetical protein